VLLLLVTVGVGVREVGRCRPAAGGGGGQRGPAQLLV